MRTARILPCALLGLAACATTPFAPTSVVAGDTHEDVVRKMGPPTATYTMPGGLARLEYNRMPFGRKTYMIDFDSGGRVTRWEQVLDENHFAAIVPGMRSEDVLRLIGPPSFTGNYFRPKPGITWSYRYEVMPRCTVFEVAFDAASGDVLAGAYPPDPGCPEQWH